ncbi:MAG: hypothetical protein ABIH37_00980 [archaeon]
MAKDNHKNQGAPALKKRASGSSTSTRKTPAKKPSHKPAWTYNKQKELFGKRVKLDQRLETYDNAKNEKLLGLLNEDAKTIPETPKKRNMLDAAKEFNEKRQYDRLRNSGKGLVDIYVFKGVRENYDKGFDNHLVDIMESGPDKLWQEELLPKISSEMIRGYLDRDKSDANFKGVAREHLKFAERFDNIRDYVEGEKAGGTEEGTKARKVIWDEYDKEYSKDFKDNMEDYKLLCQVAEIMGLQLRNYNKKSEDQVEKFNKELKTSPKKIGYIPEIVGKPTVIKLYQQSFQANLAA